MNKELQNALYELLQWACGNRGPKGINPYGVPEVEQAHKVLLKSHGVDGDWLDAKEVHNNRTNQAWTRQPICWLSDPGHGWLKVPHWHLVALGIQKDISTYSYVDDSFVYLEEDLDAGIYLRAREAQGYGVPDNIPDHHHSPRHLDHYYGGKK